MTPAHKLLLILGAMVFLRAAHSRQCPSGCNCQTDPHGLVLAVYCINGLLTAIPTDQIDHSTRTLIISAPSSEQANYITIGNVLVHPVPYSKLEELHIVRSNIQVIGQHSFWGLVKLTLLNLTQNIISSVSEDNFRGLVNLKSLYLNDNYIENLRSETFCHLPELQVLNLARNRVTNLVPKVFRMLGKLVSLDLSDNNLTELNPEVFKDIQNLATFKCRKCNLKMINTQIYHLLSDLQILDLGGNQFKYLMADEFISLKKLKVLRLDGNQLPVILDYSFRMQTSLNTLSLERNRLVMLTPGAFINLIHLENLDISYNKLEKLQIQTFAPIGDSLRGLDMSGNNINLEYLTTILEILPALRQLKMANMSFTKLPDDLFMSNPLLVSLSISGNLLNIFPYKMLSYIRHLQSFDISRNKLQGLDAEALYRLESIAKVKIDENPWHCVRCKIKTIIEFMHSTVLNNTMQGLKCFTPKELKGVHINSVTEDTMLDCDYSGSDILSGESKMSIAATFMLGVFLIILGTAACFCCSKRYAAEYYTEEEKENSNEAQANACQGENIEMCAPQTNLELSPFNMDKMNGLVATIHAPYQMNRPPR